jgi:16S rRNA (guanine(966)-N(2))-methyltransferase RsmD
MRVIAGSAKGTPLQAVPGPDTRPISDRVKEAVFGILGDGIIGARVVDLFAGTGSVGIEALSRGAEWAVFVEKQSKATAVIKANLARTRLQAQARVVQADVFKFLAGQAEPFDLIYIAPPQYHSLWKKSLVSLDSNPDLLAADGWTIVQIDPVEYEPLPMQHFHEFDQRRYGSTLLVFYQR